MCSLFDDAHAVLSKLGLPDGGISLAERIINFGDRLMLRPEGEPDTADLVGKINEICERVGLGEGSPVELVQRLAEKFAAIEHDRRLLLTERNAARADLAAERAQLAAAEKPEPSVSDNATLDRVFRLVNAGTVKRYEVEYAKAVLIIEAK